MQTNLIKVRTLPEICEDIRANWKNMYYGAIPYFLAMETLNTINDNYGMESGRSIVLYFLANAQMWKGERAKQIKAELKKMAGIK